VLVFEGPAGAFSREPERFALPEPAVDLRIDQFGGGYAYDLVAAAGKELVFLQGRDTGLDRMRVHAGEGPVTRRSVRLPERAAKIATGDFIFETARDVAVVTESGALLIVDGATGDVHQTAYAFGPKAISDVRAARLSSRPKDDLVLVDRDNRRLHILHESHFEQLRGGLPEIEPSGRSEAPAPVFLPLRATPHAALPMTLNADGLNDLVVSVTHNGGVGLVPLVSMPLRDIMVTESGGQFLLSTSGETCITQDGGCSMAAAVQLANKLPGADRIRFEVDEVTPPSFSVTETVTIDGSDVGRAYLPNVGQYRRGIEFAEGSESSVVKNLAVQWDVVLSSTGGGTRVEGCHVGTAADGMPTGSSIGLRIEGPRNTIGGADESQRNVLKSLSVKGDENQIVGNYIGLASDGKTVLEGDSGVGAGSNNQVGGKRAGEGNAIGRSFTLSGRGTMLFGNSIGLSADETEPAGNTQDGLVLNVAGQTVGGAGIGMGNTISGNGRNGIAIRADSLRILGNRIGTDGLGRRAVPNTNSGIEVQTGSQDLTDVWIGSSEWGGGNTISGNGELGIKGARGGVRILGNFVGTDVTGMAPLPNGTHGIYVWGPSGAVIGGADPAASNVISSNTASGILVSASGVELIHNYIGTDRTGSIPLGNGAHGIELTDWSSEAPRFKIGGENPNEANTIAFNTGDGIFVAQAKGPATIWGNRIWSNGGLGIDILSTREDEYGVNLNDDLDRDEGPNGRQNHPELSLLEDGSVAVSLNSTPQQTYRIEFFGNAECDPSGHGEGEVFLDALTLTTDARGNASTTKAFAVFVGQEHITATATDPLGNTSEFSACAQVVGRQPLRARVMQRDESGEVVPVPNTSFELGTFEPDRSEGPHRVLETRITDDLGFITLSNATFQADSPILVRALAHVEPAVKGGHEAVDNAMYHVYVDNLIVLPNGSIEMPNLKPDDENVADILLTRTEIVYNLVVSIEWKAGSAYVEDLGEALRLGSDYLLDVTNGQAYLGKVAIYDNRANWTNADIRVLANSANRGHAPIYAIRQAGATGGENVYIQVGPREFGGPDLSRNGLPSEIPLNPKHPDHYRTLIHEWGHYAFGFQDEYMNAAGKTISPFIIFGFMDTFYPDVPGSPAYMKSEMSEKADEAYRETAQWTANGRTCWGQFKADFDQKRFGTLVTRILAPADIGATAYVPGPNEFGGPVTYPVGRHMPVVMSSTEPTAPGLVLRAVVELPDAADPGITRELPVANAEVVLFGEQLLNLGKTADDGRIQILGANTGDEVSFEAQVYASVSPFGGSTRLLHATKSVAAGMQNPTVVVLGQIENRSQLITTTRPTGPTTADLIALGVRLFGAPLKMEMQSEDGARRELIVRDAENGYSATIDDLPGGESAVFVSTVDDAGRPFRFTHRVSVMDVPAAGKVDGNRAGSMVRMSTTDPFELELDRSASSVSRVIVTSSDWAPPRGALPDSLRRMSRVFSVAVYPEDAILTGSMRLRYDAPAGIAEMEEGFALYRWEEAEGWTPLDAVVDGASRWISTNETTPGVYAVFNDMRITGTGVDGKAGAPARPLTAALGDPYPNPLRQSTAVPFELKEPTWLELVAVDVLGRTVRSVASGIFPAGRHEVIFDAVGLPPGTYFLRLTTDRSTQVRRAVVLR
jgi:hypothetical protein